MKAHGFTRRERLVRKTDFDATYKLHRSATDGTIVLYARPNGLGWSRLGMSVSGRLGDSVTRNRFKRICREAFRLHKSELPVGFDFIVIPRGRLERTLDATADSLVKLSRRLCEAKV